MTSQSQNDVCCPEFNPAPWDGRELVWEDRKFIKDKVCTLFYMPMNFGSVMKRVDEKVRKANATIQDGMWLSDHTSKWNMNLYLAVDKEVPGAENVALSGKFLCKVYEGDFSKTGKWTEEFKVYVQGRNQVIKKMYMWYTTCPKCAKKYGKNYVVIVGQVD